MRQLIAGLSFAAFTWGCNVNDLPLSPTPSVTAGSPRSFNVSDGNWTPWFFREWQPGIGEPLALDTAVQSIVENGDVCVAHLRSTWDARASCKRFTVSVPIEGRLDAFLWWDGSAPGFDPSLAGDVVLVAPSGQFTASGWQHPEEHIFASVQPGDYAVLVMSYVPASLPFQIRAELRPE